MSNRNCVVLQQYRDDSEYNDFIGKYYHFPKRKYLNLLSVPNLEFVYYEPKKMGDGVYFGYGRIGKIFDDKRNSEHCFAEIDNYKIFSKPVPFLDNKDRPREVGPTYNVQNAVRRVEPEILDEICLDGGIVLTFRADAHLMKVLGEELIATEKVGILELIKNAYDAQASYCKIRIEKVPSLPMVSNHENKLSDLEGPVIIIEDDGIGMDKNTIENGWLRPAATLKTNVKERIKQERSKALESGNFGTYEGLLRNLKKAHGGRLPLGEKGVGRFATRRLGTKVVIRSKIKENSYEYVLKINWDEFDRQEGYDQKDLDSVGVSLFREEPSRDYGSKNSGTQITIYGGRHGFELTEEIIRDINQTILQMKSPHRAPTGFDILFECPQISDLDRSLIFEEFEPVFTFDGKVDSKGVCKFELKFNPPKSVPLPSDNIEEKDYDLKRASKEYWKDNKTSDDHRHPQCGPFSMHLNIWYRTAPWIEGPKIKQFTKYLDNFGGIAIYKDGLNVYSSELGAQIDWLKLSTRQIKRVENLSYYNMIGSIELEQTANIELIDKTNREGMLRNVAYEDLSTLVKTIVLYIENQFVAKRNHYNDLTGDLIREPKELRSVSKQASVIIENLAEKYDVIEDPSQILGQIGKGESQKERLINLSISLRKLQKSLSAMQEVQDLLIEQAGYGIAVAVSVHEIAKLTSNFYNAILELVKGGTLTKKRLDELSEASASLKSELKRLGPLRAIRSEAKQEFNVLKSIDFAYEVYKSKLKKLLIEVKIKRGEGFKVYARYGALNQIFTNVMDNSCYWLDAAKVKDRLIQIIVDLKYRTILFADNGPDIDDSIRPYLFQAGYSLKDPPSGLGLYICKHYMHDMKGNIFLAPQKDRIENMPGAQFLLDFSKVPESREGT